MEPLIEPIPSELLPEDKRFKALPHHEILFKPPFTAVAIGAIGSGKSSFCYSLIDKHYKNYFDEVVVISGTIDSKESWEKVNQRNVIFLDFFDESAFKEYIETLEKDQEERKKEGKFPTRVLLVLDDIIFDGYNKNRVGVLEKLFYTCRHYFISILLCLQQSKQISAGIRNQIFYWNLFRLTQNDLNKMAEEHSNHLSADEFKAMYNSVMKKGKHEWLQINYKNPFNKRFLHRFTTVLNPTEESSDSE
jgi:hypothetical protein